MLQHKIQICTDDTGNERLVVRSKSCDMSLSEEFDKVDGRNINKYCLNVVDSSS